MSDKLPCGCTDEVSCDVELRLHREWTQAAERYERSLTGGSEYNLRKAYGALARHRNSSFRMMPQVGPLGGY